MENGFFDVSSDLSSDELSETQSELEARIYSVVHHNDFSGTSVTPFIDPKYGVEFTADGEVVVYLKDAATDPVAEPSVLCKNGVIPTIVLDDDDDDDDDGDDVVVARAIDNVTDVSEYAETSLKKKKKKKKKKNANDTSIEEYIDIVKKTDALKEYKELSGFNKMHHDSSKTDNVAINVACRNERALPMTPDEVLGQYAIGKPTEDSLWYRCPKTWTSGMIKYYTKIQKSKRNFDCGEEMRKVREKYGSDPNDWTLDPLDIYKSYSNASRGRCNSCRQFGHTAFNCKSQYKPEVCIMCGTEGHNFRSCSNKICLSCGIRQPKFTNNCSVCLSKSRSKCSMCNTVGHESNNCSESWRQFHSTISTSPEERRSGDFAQSTSGFNADKVLYTPRKTSSAPSTPNVTELNNKSFKTNELGKSKKAKRLQRLREKKRHSKIKNSNNLSVATSDNNESINIDVNIQDVTVKRTLTKKNFFKKQKFSV